MSIKLSDLQTKTRRKIAQEKYRQDTREYLAGCQVGPKTYEILLPPLAKELSPNCRCHWAEKAKAVKQARKTAYILCLVALVGRHKPRWREAVEETTFIFATKHRCDADNLAASLKSYFDGFVDAGLLLDDDKLTHLPIIIRYGFPDEKPGIIIRIAKGRFLPELNTKKKRWDGSPRAIPADFEE